MDDKKKHALIEELSVAKNFEPSYSKRNRCWFVKKLIRGYEAAGISDQQVETKTRSVVAQSKGIVIKKRDFQLKLELDPDTERWSRPQRVEVLYGLIATDPGFVETTNEDFLDFVAARRYRAVQRMIRFVNSPRFRYPPDDPSECPSKPEFHVNAAAAPFWEPAVPKKLIPLKLKPQPASGTVKPLEAITNLWQLQGDPCEENVLECAAAVTCVLMDSLLEAEDPAALLKAVTDRGPNHLLIGHPLLDRNKHLLWDETATRLFSKEGAPATDLQVGDHVYVWNHPIYASLDPAGVWRGEHSLVVELKDRNLKNGIRFSGHGFELDTIAKINDAFLKTVNTLLHRAYTLGSIFLEYMRSGGTSLPASDVTGPEHVQTTVPSDNGTQTVDVDLYLFDIDYEFNDYRQVPLGASIPKRQGHGFIFSHMPGGLKLPDNPARPTFALHGWETNLARVKFGDPSENIAPNPLGRRPFFQRTESPPSGGSGFDPPLWQLVFQGIENPHRDKPPPFKLRKLFKRVKGRLDIELIRPQEMPEEPLGKWKHALHEDDPLPQNVKDREEVILTRPTVILFDTPYEDFLKAAGAIP